MVRHAYYRSSLAGDTTRSAAEWAVLADWLRTHGFSGSQLQPIGPATDVVKAMDKAISGDRSKRRRAGAGKPHRGKRLASIKETGEEVPQEEWERFEAADRKPRK